MTELTDRVVLITSAAGGIGSATARALAGAGAHVALHDVDAGGPRFGSWPTSSATAR
jgi:NAD(P)-dependent dehydrogenase (short-subunit alcohol dehydrogenase family)